jgi:peptidase E
MAGTILAMGGGGFSMERSPLLDEFVLSLARGGRPRICFLGTASGDSPEYAARFLRAFRRQRCVPLVLSLLQPPRRSLQGILQDQDVVYVGGGNTRALLALWREWEVDRILRRAWRNGTVMAGLSAGSICWFEQGLSDSVESGRLLPLDGLGILPGSNCPHYDGEAGRRPAYRRLVGSGGMKPGWAADDGAGLLFVGRKFVRAVSSRPAARAWRLERRGGRAVETEVVPAYLG